MSAWIEAVMAQVGYLGIAVLMFLETIFPPVPSETIMPLGGYAAAQGTLTLPGVILAGSVGSLSGAVVLYAVGMLVGRDVIYRWTERYGRWLTVSRGHVEQAERWFIRYPALTLLLARLVPGVRSVVSLPAGMTRVRLLSFVVLTGAGTAIWSGLLTLAGFLLGENFHLVEQQLGASSRVLVVFVTLGLAGLVGWRVTRRR